MKPYELVDDAEYNERHADPADVQSAISAPVRMVLGGELATLPSRCETCDRRPPVRVVGGRYCCLPCGRTAAANREEVAAGDVALQERLPANWRRASELNHEIEAIRTRQAMTDEELREHIRQQPADLPIEKWGRG